MRGYDHAVPTNMRRLSGFRAEVLRAWRHALGRRGQRVKPTWARMNCLGKHWLPYPRVLHPYPWDRFDDRTQGGSRVR
jgi:RNA-directed DNA polymerase